VPTAPVRQLPFVAAAGALALFVASPAIAGSDHVRAEGTLVRWSDAVPEDAEAVVTATYDPSGRTTVLLRVEGLLPDTEYGAHVHLGECGPKESDAGPTFMNALPPRPELVNTPLWSNPHNQIWLDLTTDARGTGKRTAKVNWQFVPGHHPGSVVLHEDHTSTGRGPGPLAGMAGAGVACLDVEF
jgi:superoxide dismutase, Cu-Zn family